MSTEISIETYAGWFGIATIGAIIQALLRVKAIKDKSRKANLQFRIKDYFIQDWLSFLISFTTVILFMILFPEFTNISEKVMDYSKTLFAFVGYTSSDIASRFFSVVNKKVNAAIDYKTTIADETTGTTESPTPIE